METPLPTLRSAFTRADFMALLGSVSLLAVLFITSAGTTRRGSQVLVCRNNLQRLADAWLVYAGDSKLLVGNVNGGAASSTAPAKATTWATGVLDWVSTMDNTNTAKLQTAAFARYIGPDVSVFKCPSDAYLSPTQRKLGWVRRVRTYSMNAYVGPSGVEEGPFDSSFIHFQSLAQVTPPGEIFVFTEEHPDSMNDPMLIISPRATQFIDLPASFHSRGANFTFADGHVEGHRWASASTVLPVRYVSYGGFAPQRGDPDLLWLGAHASRPK